MARRIPKFKLPGASRPEDSRESAEFPGYWVTADGQIWSANKRRILRQGTDKDGYLEVTAARRGGISRPIRIHQLVCAAFCGEPPTPTHQVRHLDGDNLNNLPGNLEWGTSKENSADRRKHGRDHFVNANPLAKLDKYKIRAIRLLLSRKVTSKRIAEIFKIGTSCVRSIARRDTWNHVV